MAGISGALPSVSGAVVFNSLVAALPSMSVIV
jgi:hypothetical protein